MHEVLVNCLGSLSLPRKSVVRLTGSPDITIDIYRGRETTTTTLLSGALSYSQIQKCQVSSFAPYQLSAVIVIM